MSGSKSNYASKKALEELLGGVAYVSAAHVYLALCTTLPDDTSTGSTIVETETGTATATLGRVRALTLAAAGHASVASEFGFLRLSVAPERGTLALGGLGVLAETATGPVPGIAGGVIDDGGLEGRLALTTAGREFS